MIAKLIKGKGFKGVMAYLLEGSKPTPTPRGQLILSNMTGNTPKALAREFGQLRSLRAGLNKAVFHASISLSPEDRAFSDTEFSAIAQRFVDEMGFQDCPFAVVRHHDTDHQHIHIVSSRITLKGDVVSDAHDFRRAETIMRKLEEEYGPHPPAERMEKKQQQGGNTMNTELKSLLEEAINNSENIQQFITECQKRGIDPIPHIQGKRMGGLAFRFRKNKSKVKGSDLGKRYGWQFISVALKYDSDKDFQHLQKLKEAEDANLPQATPANVDERQQRDYARRLLDDGYEAMLRFHFGERLADLNRGASTITITLKNGVQLNDFGNRVSAEGGSQKEIAKETVNLARQKGWKSIQFSGNDDFIRFAMMEAMQNGLEISTKDEWQATLLEEARKALNPAQDARKSIGQMLEAISPEGIKQKLSDIRKEAGLDDTGKEQDIPRNKPRFK